MPSGWESKFCRDHRHRFPGRGPSPHYKVIRSGISPVTTLPKAVSSGMAPFPMLLNTHTMARRSFSQTQTRPCPFPAYTSLKSISAVS